MQHRQPIGDRILCLDLIQSQRMLESRTGDFAGEVNQNPDPISRMTTKTPDNVSNMDTMAVLHEQALACLQVGAGCSVILICAYITPEVAYRYCLVARRPTKVQRPGPRDKLGQW